MAAPPDDDFPIILMTGKDAFDKNSYKARSHAARTGWKKRDATHFQLTRRTRPVKCLPSPAQSSTHSDNDVDDTRHGSGCISALERSRALVAIQSNSVGRSVLPSGDGIFNPQNILLHHTDLLRFYHTIYIPGIRRFCNTFHGPLPTPEGMFIRDSTFYSMCASLMVSYDDLRTKTEPGTLPSALQRRTSRRAAKYCSLAFQHLRTELAELGQADDTCLNTMACMSIVASKLGDMQQQMLHRRALADIVKQRGGLSSVAGSARAFLLRFECAAVLETGVTVLEDLEEWCKQQQCRDAKRQVALQQNRTIYNITPDRQLHCIDRLPPGFQILVYEGLITKALTNIALETMNQQEALRRRITLPQVPLHDHINSTKSYDLFAACPDLVRAPGSVPTINWLTFMGMLMYNSVALNDLDLWASVTLWPGIPEGREALTHSLLQVLSTLSARDLLRVSIVQPMDEQNDLDVAIEQLLVWLSLLCMAMWKTSNGTIASRGLELAAALASWSNRSARTVQILLRGDLTGKESAMRSFFWSDKFDLPLIDTAIQACLISVSGT